MSKISELRRAAELRRQRQVEEIRQSIVDTISSSSMEASMLDALAKKDKAQNNTSIIEQISESIVDNALNPVNEFLDVCKMRGLHDIKVKRIAKNLSKALSLTDSEIPEEQIEAVAIYLKCHPSLYSEIENFC